MSKQDATLLDQIEDDAVNGRPIADTLRKAVILGGKARSTALRDWATKELKGYAPADELPDAPRSARSDRGPWWPSARLRRRLPVARRAVHPHRQMMRVTGLVKCPPWGRTGVMEQPGSPASSPGTVVRRGALGC